MAGILWARGFVPVVWRLGRGLSTAKIAVFAKGDAQDSLQSLLRDSGIFRQRLVAVRDAGDLHRAASASVYLVHWPDWQDAIGSILDLRPRAVVVFAPQGRGTVPADAMRILEQHPNVTLVNFRGRLLNDLVASMITTSL